MKKDIKILVASLFLSIFPVIFVWIPFILRLPSFWNVKLPQNGLATIVANYDGPLYLVVARTLYNKTEITNNFQFPLPAEYYTAHFPLFPLLIRAFSFVTNYPYAMLIVTLLSGAIATYFFRKLIGDYVSEKNAWYLTFLFSIFPARWLIVKSTGSADPLFIAGIIASLYFFKHKKYWWAAIWGVIAQVTKSPGIILFGSYFLYFVITHFKKKFGKAELSKTYPLLLIPLSLILVFGFYAITTGNFWAYFASGDNIHLFFPPFQIFDYSAPWVGTFWLEEVIFIYMIGAIGVYKLFEKKEYEIAVFSLFFFFLTLFISHRDLLRYTLPLVPFLFVAFSDTLTKKEFRAAILVVIIPIYLFSLAFISQNVMPISNWAPFL